MSTETRALPAFGKRSADEVWAKAQHQKRELTICPLRFSACFALLIGGAFLLLLEAIELMSSGSANPAGLLVLIPAALLAQCAVATFSLAVDGKPLVTIDTAGIVVMSRSGEAEMTWEEVARMEIGLGSVRLDRRPRAVARLCTRPAFDKQRVRVPTFLIAGGTEAFREAVAELRPDVARRFFA